MPRAWPYLARSRHLLSSRRVLPLESHHHLPLYLRADIRIADSGLHDLDRGFAGQPFEGGQLGRLRGLHGDTSGLLWRHAALGRSLESLLWGDLFGANLRDQVLPAGRVLGRWLVRLDAILVHDFLYGVALLSAHDL